MKKDDKKEIEDKQRKKKGKYERELMPLNRNLIDGPLG